MRPLLAAAAALTILAPAASAQSATEPSLIFGINLGLSTGQHLWSVAGQPLQAPNNSFDTVALDRRLRPGLLATVNATLFRSPRLGFTAEVGYFGFGSEQRCTPPAAWQPDGQNVNQQACTRAQGLHRATSVVGLLAGVQYRFAPAGSLQPSLRLTVGPGFIGNSYVRTSGAVVASPGCSPSPCELVMLDERGDPSLTWLVSGGLALAVSLAPAYRLRMELRDVVTSLPVTEGPAPGAGGNVVAPTGRRIVHVPSFLFGVELVFERRHTRRY